MVMVMGSNEDAYRLPIRVPDASSEAWTPPGVARVVYDRAADACVAALAQVFAQRIAMTPEDVKALRRTLTTAGYPRAGESHSMKHEYLDQVLHSPEYSMSVLGALDVEDVVRIAKVLGDGGGFQVLTPVFDYCRALYELIIALTARRQALRALNENPDQTSIRYDAW